MSSILDALNKVEEDRNARDSGDDAPFVPERAADTLLATPKNRRRTARHSLYFKGRFLAVAIGGGIVVALIVALSAGVAAFVGKNAPVKTAVAVAPTPPKTSPVQAVAPETQTPAPSEVTPKPEEKPVPQAETPPKPVPAPVPEAPAPPKAPVSPEFKVPAPEPVKAVAEKPVPKPPVAPVKVAKAASQSAEEPTTPLPTFEAVEKARAAANEVKAPVTLPQAPPTSLAPGRAAEKHAPFLEDINGLARLGQTEREKLGLGELRLNVLREASPSQPEGLAIINLKKVYVGEMIPGTNARLIAVKSRAIAIEIEGTGERFKVMN